MKIERLSKLIVAISLTFVSSLNAAESKELERDLKPDAYIPAWEYSEFHAAEFNAYQAFLEDCPVARFFSENARRLEDGIAFTLNTDLAEKACAKVERELALAAYSKIVEAAEPTQIEEDAQTAINAANRIVVKAKNHAFDRIEDFLNLK